MRPLSGMPGDRTTSKAEIRSVATNKNASPRSYTSRTFPRRASGSGSEVSSSAPDIGAHNRALQEKEESMRKKILVAILSLTPLVMSAEGATCSPITSNVFDAALTNSGLVSPFANASLSLHGTEATVVANALGLPNADTITTVTLYRGQPGSPRAQLIQTFSASDTSVGPQFIGTATLSAAQIAGI